MAIAAERRAAVRKDYRRHDTDSGSPEVQIALLTEEAAALSEHLKGHVKDFSSRRGLQTKVNKRNQLLAYLARTEPDRYRALIGRLGLRK